MITNQFTDNLILTDEAVTWAFRFFLDRDPLSQTEINFHKIHKNIFALRDCFLNTTEFKLVYNRALQNDGGSVNYSLPMCLLPEFSSDIVFKKNNINFKFSIPTLEEPTSQLCTFNQFNEFEYKKWCIEMCVAPTTHRKQWEFVFILAVLDKNGLLKSGARGLGFGTGKEPLPSVFAKYGLTIVASDAPANYDAAQGWSTTNQFSQNVIDLFYGHLVDRELFMQNTSWLPVDMNDIPPSLINFDFCWSACAFEHLGSIDKGLAFVKNSLKTLRPGGLAIHTTEFNLSSNTLTLESPNLCLFRKCDFELLAEELNNEGHEVLPINWHPGLDPIDEVIDFPPYTLPHLKIALQDYVTTSIGLVVKKRKN